MGGLKTGPSRRHRIQPAEGPFLDPRAKETCFKKGSESGPLEIKSGPPWRVQFWSLFGPFNVANLLRRLFQVEADLTSNSSGWNLELYVICECKSVHIPLRRMFGASLRVHVLLDGSDLRVSSRQDSFYIALMFA